MGKYTGKRARPASDFNIGVRRIQRMWRARKGNATRARYYQGGKMALHSPLVDKVVYLDSTCVSYIRMGPAPQNTEMAKVFSRFDYSSIWGTNAGINSTPRFNGLHPNFLQYAVMGLKIEYTPTNTMSVPGAGHTPSQLVLVYTVDDVQRTPTIAPSWATSVIHESYQGHDPKNSFVVYRDNKKLAHQDKVGWFDANPNLFSTTNGGPQASITIGWKYN